MCAERRTDELRIRPGTAHEQVLAECHGLLDQLMTTHGSVAFGLLNRDGLDPSQADLRDEHVHEAVEVFAVIGGRGQVSLRLGDYVYAVLCEKGDVLVIPAGVRRWVDLGTTRSAWRCACLAANRGCSRSSPAIRWPGSLPAWMSFEVRFHG